MSAMNILPNDPRLSWPGAISLEHTADGTRPWRLPYHDRGLFPPDALRQRAATAAGVRIAFRSDTSSVSGSVRVGDDISAIDLCIGGRLVGSQPLSGMTGFQFDGLPAGEKLVELWLPQFGEFWLRSLELSDGASITRHEDTRPRWVTYGSSITHCRAAESPVYTWPAVVARERGLNLTCLGFGGQCHLDVMVARLIRDLPADYLSMCVGINIYGSGSLNVRSFRPGIIGFVQVVRERHADVPFAVMSPIISPPREATPNAVGFTLQAMRLEAAEAVEALRAHGDRHVHYVDGLRVFGSEEAHLLPDNVHPNAVGYKVMGANFLKHVANEYFV
jgi:lysophospholipase L1-like esterase